MNIFEGSRRIATLIGGAWIIGTIVGAFMGAFTKLAGGFEFDDFLGSLFLPPLFITGFTFAMGWIVRGFMGIPMGRDSKTD